MNKRFVCQHCADTYPDFDVAHVCSRGPYAPKLNENIKTGADIHAGDGGYSLGTQEKYNEFIKDRNRSLGKARIRALLEQSGVKYVTMPEDTVYEKFAELIVRECDRYARSAWEHGPLLGRDLLVHFGIEDINDN